jgi:signal transduction histidine kinase
LQSNRWARDIAVVLILAAVYFVAARFGLRLASLHPSATPVWPPTGISLAALLIFGYRVWPGILLGAFLANLMTAGTAATSIGIAIGNTLEGVVSAFLVRRFSMGGDSFDHPYEFFKFALLAGSAGPVVSATCGVGSLALGGFLPPAQAGSIWFTWWVGDATAQLVVAPLLLLWWGPWGPPWKRRRIVEALLVMGGVLVTGLIVFTGLFAPAISSHPLTFLCVPLLVWTAFRFGPRETALANVLTASVAIYGTYRELGPFAHGTPNESLLLLQSFVAVTALMSMSLAALVQERQRVREELERQAVELARSNTELEQFAYAASHDLKEPLRMVTLFLELLSKRYRGRLDREADEFIQYAVDGADKMSRLIDNVLTFSRAGTSERSTTPARSDEALQRALHTLSSAVAESGAVVTSGVLPAVIVDPSQLTQVFQNLLSNALKFRGGGAPEVHIGAERDGGDWTFSVRDNGIGIEPEHAERIFKIFQRLHGRDGYPGTGIGLAICRKIIERHGGRIWVVSERGKGATFRFSLPAADR